MASGHGTQCGLNSTEQAERALGRLGKGAYGSDSERWERGGGLCVCGRRAWTTWVRTREKHALNEENKVSLAVYPHIAWYVSYRARTRENTHRQEAEGSG